MPEEEPKETGEPGKIQFAELLNLNQEEHTHFNELVAQNDGLVRVLVHPFYTNPDQEEFISKKTGDYFTLGGTLSTKGFGPKEKRYFEAVERLVKKCSLENIPLVIFEEADKTDNLVDLFTGLDTQNVLLAPTKRSSPYPFFPEDPEGMQCKKEKTFKYNSDLEGIAVLLKDLGVEKAIVGGRRLDLIKYDIKNSIPYYDFIYRHPVADVKGVPFSKKLVYADGCVGFVGQALKKNGISTQFSTISGMTYLGYDFRKDE